MAERPFEILMVCTGNICRSPMAEQLLRLRLAEELATRFGPERGAALASQVAVHSAGLVAQAGAQMPAEALAEAKKYGGDGSAHAAKRLLEAHVADADLVLGMAREHRRESVSLVPRASRTAFTLTEFARLLRELPDRDDLPPFDGQDLAGFLRAVVAHAGARRGYLPPADPETLDIVDPYRRSTKVYARAGAAIAEAVGTVSREVGALVTRA